MNVESLKKYLQDHYQRTPSKIIDEIIAYIIHIANSGVYREWCIIDTRYETNPESQYRLIFITHKNTILDVGDIIQRKVVDSVGLNSGWPIEGFE